MKQTRQEQDSRIGQGLSLIIEGDLNRVEFKTNCKALYSELFQDGAVYSVPEFMQIVRHFNGNIEKVRAYFIQDKTLLDEIRGYNTRGEFV